jgi:hypothetical protein
LGSSAAASRCKLREATKASMASSPMLAKATAGCGEDRKGMRSALVLRAGSWQSLGCLSAKLHGAVRKVDGMNLPSTG